MHRKESTQKLERAGWPLEYCGRIAVQMIGNFYDGVYRRYA